MDQRPSSSEKNATPHDTDTGEFPTLAPRVSVLAAGATHPGKVRTNNEDQFLIAHLAKTIEVDASSLPEQGEVRSSDEVGHILVVADGMGGAAAGEEASTIAVESVKDFALNTLKWFLRLGGTEGHALLSELRSSLERADHAVIERAKEEPRFFGMGTTLTMAYSLGADLFVVHAGDSRAYVYHEGELEQVTNDHTLVQIMVDNGAITREQARVHKRRHVVTNVIGGPGEGVHVEIHKLNVRDGDVLLLCSDGLTEAATDAEIAEVLGQSSDPAEASQKLVELALRKGGPDNITTVVARFHVA